MGGAVSSGESNDDLIDNLLEADYIKSPSVEKVFRAVDRALYYTEGFKMNAYKDLAWKDGNLHLSAPCIYSEVLENLQLKPGMSFLNMGSGTGYLSTMCGLMLGNKGINHGIELYQEVVDYAYTKLEEFLITSAAVDMFDFCHPSFVVGNCLDPLISTQRYDRIYCGAACPEDCIRNITDLLKVGGMCVIPINDSLVQITRVSEDKEERKGLLPVSFASLIAPRSGIERKPVTLPWVAPTLQHLCRSEIRSILRSQITPPETRIREDGRRKRRRRRQERRRASRLLVVQRRRSINEGPGGFVAVAYTLGGNRSSDEENSREALENRLRRDNDHVINYEFHDEDMQDHMHEDSDDDDDDDDDDDSEDFELPDLEDDVAMNEPEPSRGVANASDSSSNDSTNVPAVAPSSAGASDAALADRAASLANRDSPIRNRLINRTRQNRPQGIRSEGVFERIREIFRQRDPTRNNNMVRQMQQITRGTSIREFVSNTSETFHRQAVPDTERNGQAAQAREARETEENSASTSTTTAAAESNGVGNNPRSSGEPRRRNRRYDSNVYSSDSSLHSIEDSSSSWSTSEDENDHDSSGNTAAARDSHRVSTESGVATDTERKTSEESTNDKGEKAENKEELSSETDAQNHPFSVQLRSKISELPLPSAIKIYLNYQRQLK